MVFASMAKISPIVKSVTVVEYAIITISKLCVCCAIGIVLGEAYYVTMNVENIRVNNVKIQMVLYVIMAIIGYIALSA
jgi:hypothetical protein